MCGVFEVTCRAGMEKRGCGVDYGLTIGCYADGDVILSLHLKADYRIPGSYFRVIQPNFILRAEVCSVIQ